MDVSFSAKPQTFISSFIIPLPSFSSRSSSHFYHFPTTVLRTEFLGSGIRWRPPSLPSGRRCRKSALSARSPRFLIRATFYGRSILVAVAVAVANFAALRLFYLNYMQSKKEAPKGLKNKRLRSWVVCYAGYALKARALGDRIGYEGSFG